MDKHPRARAQAHTPTLAQSLSFSLSLVSTHTHGRHTQRHVVSINHDLCQPLPVSLKVRSQEGVSGGEGGGGRERGGKGGGVVIVTVQAWTHTFTC